MTPRQSNIIFYTIISFIVTAIIIHVVSPDFFGDLAKNKEELLLKEAVEKGNYKQALTSYQVLVDERIKGDNAISTETAVMYEDMAKLYFSLGNKVEEKNHYLKSLNIKKQLPKNDVFAFGNTYYQLGRLAEDEQQYGEAQAYFEKSLAKRLGNAAETVEKDEGFTNTMHKNRLKHIRLNNEGTIATLKKLAAVHIIKKEYAIAKSYYERALAASKLTFGEDSSETLKIMDLMKKLEL